MKKEYERFGRELKRLRKRDDITQETLKDELQAAGVTVKSKGTISKWEKGEHLPKNSETVEVLEQILGVTDNSLQIAAGYLEEPEISSAPTPLDYAKGKALGEHFDRLSQIVSALLANGLDTVTKNDPNLYTHPYTLWSGQSGISIPHELLSSYLQKNIDQLFLEYIDSDLQNFMSHLEAEYPDIGYKGLRKVVAENPYELIEILRVLVRKGTFNKGTCSVCKDWYGV